MIRNKISTCILLFDFKTRWTDVTSVDKSNNLMFPDSVCVSTRESDFHFGMFLGGQAAGEAHDLISQLANLAMRKLIDENAVAESTVLNRYRRRTQIQPLGHKFNHFCGLPTDFLLHVEHYKAK